MALLKNVVVFLHENDRNGISFITVTPMDMEKSKLQQAKADLKSESYILHI